MLAVQSLATKVAPARRHADRPGAPLRAIDLAVQEALRIQFQWGTISALEYLGRHGIAHDIVRRVLSPHGDRRSADNIIAAGQRN